MHYTKRTVGTYSWNIVALTGLFPKFDNKVKIASDRCYRLLLDLDIGKMEKEVISNEGIAGSYILAYVEVLTVGKTSNLHLHIDITTHNHNTTLFEWFVFPNNIFLFEHRNNRRS